MQEKIIGIDLGTTFSAVAVMEGGKATIIPNAEGQRITPSVVSITKTGERLVGQVARNQAITNPEHTVRSIKRHMGEDFKVNVAGKDHSPQEISAMILQKLKTDAEAYLGQTIKKAVITVPAYFSDAQRQATKDAGRIAGLEVERIINEPTAASLAYGIEKGHDHTIMVFDFGGGTFDVSVLELGDGVFEVKATSGDNHLGGDDIDELIIDWLADSFKKESGIDLRSDKTSMQRLKEAAEKAKIELSGKTSASINLPFITADASGPKHLNVELSRAQFERMIEPIIKRLEGPTKQALKDASLSNDKLDKVIFVGGSTRIPAVQRLVKDLTGKDGDKSVNPDEAVALGAAIQGGILAGEVKDVLLLDVTPLSLGIETLGGVMTALITRNTTIPTKKSQIFSTAADNQQSVTIHVLQGERPMAQDNKTLGRFDLTGIPPAPRGVPQVEVGFDIDANGIVHVTAKDKGTGREQSVRITSTTNLSEDEIKRMQNDSEKFAAEDAKRRELIDLRNDADALVYSAERVFKDAEGKVSAKEVDSAKNEITALKKLLEDKEEDARKLKSQIDKASEALQRVGAAFYQQGAGASGPGPSDEAPGDDNVKDADFKDVTDKDDKKKDSK